LRVLAAGRDRSYGPLPAYWSVVYGRSLAVPLTASAGGPVSGLRPVPSLSARLPAYGLHKRASPDTAGQSVASLIGRILTVPPPDSTGWNGSVPVTDTAFG